MANKARGEFDVTIAGKTYTLALTLGALAELGAALGVENIDDIDGKILRQVGKFVPVMQALFRGNNHQVSDDEISYGMDYWTYVEEVIPALFNRGAKTDAAKPEASDQGNGAAKPGKGRKPLAAPPSPPVPEVPKST